MTTLHIQALNNKTATASWLRTDQAAFMAQLEEQIRGEHDGLLPGDTDPTALDQWITRTYGQITTDPDLPSAARLRHWQAARLETSHLVVIDAQTAPVVTRLARTNRFPHTPNLPTPPTSAITLAWVNTTPALSTHQVTSPGMLPEENQCTAITIDEGTHRIIEWAPAPDFTQLNPELARILANHGGAIPPWLLSGDIPYTAHTRTPQEHQSTITTAVGHGPKVNVAHRIEEANVVLCGLHAGLFTLAKHHIGGLEVSVLAGPDSSSGQP